jgi:hypothetical protein
VRPPNISKMISLPVPLNLLKIPNWFDRKFLKIKNAEQLKIDSIKCHSLKIKKCLIILVNLVWATIAGVIVLLVFVILCICCVCDTLRDCTESCLRLTSRSKTLVQESLPQSVIPLSKRSKDTDREKLVEKMKTKYGKA